MKLHDFACSGCGNRFEQLLATAEEPRCPACGSGEVVRQLPAFNVGGSRTQAAAPKPLGGCGSEACAMGGCRGVAEA